MLIRFKAAEKGDGYTNITCTFHGMTYDSGAGVALLKTMQGIHDYALPMSEDEYGAFSEKLYALAAKSLMNPRLKAEIDGAPAIRTKRGEPPGAVRGSRTDATYEIKPAM